MLVASIGPGAVTILAVVLIVLALVFYLVSTIVQLRKITAAWTRSSPTSARSSRRPRRSTTSSTTSTGTSTPASTCSRGCSCRRPGWQDAVGLVEGLYPGAAAAGSQELPRQHLDRGAAHRRGLHQGHAHARAARPRGADRHGQSGRPGAAERRGRAASRRARCTRTSATRARRSCRGRPSSARDAPVQYEQRDDIGAPRRRLPDSQTVRGVTPNQRNPGQTHGSYS